MTSITTLLKRLDAELLFTGTKNLAYELISEDIFEDFYKCKNFLDLSIQKIQSFLILSMKKLLTKRKIWAKENKSPNLLEQN